VTVVFDSLDTREVCDMDEAAQGWLRANAPPHMFTAGTGLSLIWADITARNTRKMLIAGLAALVLISGILAVVLRSPKIAVLSLVPNLVPPLMAFGIWGLTVGRVGLALSVIVSMTIGIVVDDTVHFLSRYVRARRERGAEPEEAIRYAFSKVGTAMWVTTVVLIAGFGVFTLSHYRMIDEMGLMCALILALALVMDFLLLSTLLLTVETKTNTLFVKSMRETIDRGRFNEAENDEFDTCVGVGGPKSGRRRRIAGIAGRGTPAMMPVSEKPVLPTRGTKGR